MSDTQFPKLGGNYPCIPAIQIEKDFQEFIKTVSSLNELNITVPESKWSFKIERREESKKKMITWDNEKISQRIVLSNFPIRVEGNDYIFPELTLIQYVNPKNINVKEYGSEGYAPVLKVLSEEIKKIKKDTVLRPLELTTLNSLLALISKMLLHLELRKNICRV